jgi:VIT1/CCC1 family predicted Fe2+/Mn2+ transporter
VLASVRASEPAGGGLQREDLRAGLATFALVFGATLPAVVPFLVMSDKLLSLRASNAVLLALLFATGWVWAGRIGASRLGTATSITAIGVLLVSAAISLGG